MDRRLIIDGNAVYEIDETCMLKKHLEKNDRRETSKQENVNRNGIEIKRAE